MGWRQFVMNLESLDPGRVAAAFSALGALSVTMTDAGDEPLLEPLPGETPLWRDTRITALFDGDADLEQIAQRLRHSLGLAALPGHHFEDLEDRAWEREWLRDFGPMRFGERLWIVPGDDPAPDPGGVVVRLDPGLAFGTGTHPTTALCLEWLENAGVQAQQVLDFGCGSGILGIAALRLGAANVLATDVDLQAISATRQNAARNGVEAALRATTDPAPESAEFDIVVANILAGTLIDNVERVRDAAKPGGKIALSGILADQVDAVIGAYRPFFDVDAPIFREEWALLTGRRK